MHAQSQDMDKVMKQFETAHKNFWKGQHAEAMSAFEKLRSNDILQDRIADRINSYIEACKLRLKIDEIEPKSAEELYLAGIINLNNGNVEESITYLKQALAKDKDNESYTFSLACAYAFTENVSEVISLLTKAIEINEDNKVFARNNHEIAEMALENEDLAALIEDPEDKTE